MALRAIVWDFDGTILDTETPEWEGFAELYRAHGHELPLARWQEKIGTYGGFDPWEPFLSHASLEEFKRERRTTYLLRISELAIRGGVLPLLEEARDAGIVLAVASSSDRAWVSGHLERLGLLRYFPVLCTREDVPVVKPDPALYRLALERLGVAASEAVAIEDSLNGCRAALAAGLVCVVTPNAATETMVFPAEAIRGSLGSLDRIRSLVPPGS